VLGGLDGLGIDGVVAGLADTAMRCGRLDLVAAAGWLQEHQPPSAPEVICHGDLHPFNLLVAAGGAVTVLDWSAGLLAPAAYDVAFTGLVLGRAAGGGSVDAAPGGARGRPVPRSTLPLGVRPAVTC